MGPGSSPRRSRASPWRSKRRAQHAPRRFSLTLRSGEGGQGVRRIPYTSWGKSLFLATPEVLTHNGLNMVIQKAGLLKLLAVSQSVSQSVSHYHTPSRELVAHTQNLLWSSFSSVRRVFSASFFFFFWQGLHFRMMSMVFFLPFAFTYLLVGADLVESGPR